LDWRDFVRRENPVASALMVRMRIAPEDRPRVKLECIRLLATLRLNPARTQLILGFVDTYLGLSEEEEMSYQSEVEQLAPVEKEEVMEVRKSWRERDREECREEFLREGLQQGLQEGMLSVLMPLIERKLGPVDAGLRDRISALTNDQLGDLAKVLL